MPAVREAGHAVSARYDRRQSRVVVTLNTRVELAFPTRLAVGLSDVSPDNLADIEISPAGLDLHWPRLDADLYAPALLQGGRSRTDAKAAASRENGRKGGRPRKVAAA